MNESSYKRQSIADKRKRKNRDQSYNNQATLPQLAAPPQRLPTQRKQRTRESKRSNNSNANSYGRLSSTIFNFDSLDKNTRPLRVQKFEVSVLSSLCCAHCVFLCAKFCFVSFYCILFYFHLIFILFSLFFV